MDALLQRRGRVANSASSPRKVLAEMPASGFYRKADALRSMSPLPVDDQALLARAAQGEQAAFRELVERHVGMALGVARRMLRDDTEAEDVTQEAMLRLWRSQRGLELGPHGVRPWLRKVVSNLCIDRARSGRRLVVVENIPEDATPVHQTPPPGDGSVSQRVDHAIKALPERQRLALTLFHFEGLSQVEVGGVMGITDEAVESLLARARRTLKGALKDEWKDILAEEAS